MKGKTSIRLSMAALERWCALYGSAVESRFTVECTECGAVAMGDKPLIRITCARCFTKPDGDVSSEAAPSSPEAEDSPRRQETPRGSDSQDGDGACPRSSIQ